MNPTPAAGLAPQKAVKVGDLTFNRMFFVIMGDTDTRKTSTAVTLAGPGKTKFIATLPKEQFQVLPPETEVYFPFDAQNKFVWSAFNRACKEPQTVFTPPIGCLVIDDINTAADHLLIEDVLRLKQANKDIRQGYIAPTFMLESVLLQLVRHPFHIGVISTEKKDIDTDTQDREISLRLSDALHSFFTKNVSYIFRMNRIFGQDGNVDYKLSSGWLKERGSNTPVRGKLKVKFADRGKFPLAKFEEPNLANIAGKLGYKL